MIERIKPQILQRCSDITVVGTVKNIAKTPRRGFSINVHVAKLLLGNLAIPVQTRPVQYRILVTQTQQEVGLLLSCLSFFL